MLQNTLRYQRPTLAPSSPSFWDDVKNFVIADNKSTRMCTGIASEGHGGGGGGCDRMCSGIASEGHGGGAAIECAVA